MAEEFQEISASSIQGGPRSIGEIEPTLIEPTPPTTTRQSLILIQEPMDFDSETATGTEFGSSSPDSDRSVNPPANSVHMVSPKIPIETEKPDSPQNNSISTPPVEKIMMKLTKRIEINDNLSELQKAPGNDSFQSAGFSPKSSGSASEIFNSGKGSTNCYNKNLTDSQGKVNKFKCKKCDFFSTTQLDYYVHIKTYMEPDKALSCPHCPFVTEFKHHLLYHLRNHDGLKPFKCEKCSYSGVNKSMLNSHMKTHSNIYQYRCANCPFASKYCHSFKLHLRKSSHSPGMVLNADGTPNPLPIIDVYGTRRGPKIRNTGQKPAPPMLQNAENMPISFTGFPHFPESLNGIPNPYLLEMERLERDRQAISPESDPPNGSSPNSGENESCSIDANHQGVSNTSDSSEKEDEEDRRTYTTIFDNVEVVDNSPLVEIDETEDEAQTLKIDLLENKLSSAMYMDPDDTPNPSPFVVDKGGRKIKNPGQRPASPNPNILPVAPFSLKQVLANAANMSIRFPSFSFYTGFLNGSSGPLMIEIERLTRKMQTVSGLQYGQYLNSEVDESCVLDISKWEAPNRDDGTSPSVHE